MRERVTISSRGMITIPVEMREASGLRATDEVFSKLQVKAIATGTSPEEVVTASLERPCGAIRTLRSEKEIPSP